MATTIGDLRARLSGPTGVKAVKYTMVSVISVVVTLVTFALLKGVFRIDAVVSNLLSVTAGGIPSYYLNRRWVWGKSGKGHVWKEHVPFWTLNFLGLGVSTAFVAIADHWAQRRGFSHLATTTTDEVANILAFGVLWIGKFVIFNKLMFGIDHHADRAASA